jgi:uncharacterized protein with WD repeat
MAKEEFIAILNYLRRKEPFTPAEKQKYSLQEQNYIRGIQIARNTKKEDAIKEYKKISFRSEEMRVLSNEIQGKYDAESEIIYNPPKKRTIIAGPDGPMKPKQKYKYAGYVKKATKEDRNRFKSLGGKALRYLDLKTGEEISRRERDKRIYILVTNY